MFMERLDKILASQGVGSRKEAGLLIRRGLVEVNGAAVSRPEEKADPERDAISVAGKPLRFQRHLYLMMNKPAGVVSASRDSREKTVVDLVPEALFRRDLFPAGRLDRDTTGLLILTDDGDFAHRMLSPKKHVYKLYEATVDGPVGTSEIEKFEAGAPYACRQSLPQPAAALPLRPWWKSGKENTTRLKKCFWRWEEGCFV